MSRGSRRGNIELVTAVKGHNAALDIGAMFRRNQRRSPRCRQQVGEERSSQSLDGWLEDIMRHSKKKLKWALQEFSMKEHDLEHRAQARDQD